MKASEYFKKGIVNTVNYNWNPDGSVVVTIYKDGWKRSYTFKARNLFRENEEILEDEEVMD